MSYDEPICNKSAANCKRGEPTGTTFKLANSIETYVAEPTGRTKDAAILFITDVIGIWQNSQLMADQFAANGYYTIIPDLFNGDPLPINSSQKITLMEWLQNGSDGKNPHTVEAVDPIVEKALKYLREEKGFKKIGAVGYCFASFHLLPRACETNTVQGGKYVARFLAERKGIDVGFTAHPSYVYFSDYISTKLTLNPTVLSRKRSSPRLRALYPLRLLKQTRYSPPNCATNPKVFLLRPSSRSKSICSAEFRTGLP
jgi:hypothetical protein